MKKVLITMLCLVLFISGAVIFLPGFTRTGSAFIADYSFSPDGDEMTFTVSEASSIGFVRKVKVHQQYGGKLYLDCYRAFGGLNGALGAKSTYTVHLDNDTEIIALYKSKDCYHEVLHRNSDGSWERS